MKISKYSNKNPSFKKDFGTYIKENGIPNDEKIIITDDFTPLNLILYPDGLSCITANINRMIASFDFNDEILKVFVLIFEKFNLIDKKSLYEQIKQQIDQPIVIDFADSLFLVNIVGVVLSCKFSKTEKSVTTEEEFTPLIITELKIIQEPVGILVPKFLEIQSLENKMNLISLI